MAQTVKAKPFCVEKSFQNRCVEALVCQEVAEVGQSLTIPSRFFDSKRRQAEANTESQHSDYAKYLEMPVLLGAGGRSSNSLQGLQSTLETSRLCIPSKDRQWKSIEISKQEEAQQTGIKFERCGELREEQKQGRGDGIHEQVTLGCQFPSDKSNDCRSSSSRGDRNSCFDRTSDASFPKCRGGHQPSSSTSTWAQAGPWVSSSRTGGETSDIRGEGQRSCSHARALKPIRKNHQAAQGDRHPVDSNGRRMDFLFQTGQRQVRAPQGVVPSVPRRITANIYRKESGTTGCQGTDPACIPPALSGCLAQSAPGSSSHGRSGRCAQRNDGGRTHDSRGNGSHVSFEHPTRSNGWDGGDLRRWSEGYRSTKAVNKERCTQAIQSCSSTFSEQGCPTAFEAEGNRQGEGQGWKSYYTELNDLGLGDHDDSLEALLQHGPGCIQNGIVTFCDQVEIQEYDPDDVDPSESYSDMGGIDTGDQLSGRVCSMSSNAPCQFDRWCAKLRSADPSGFVDHDDECHWDVNFGRELDVDTHSLMQAHHFTSDDRVNLRALVEAAPTVGEFLVTIWAIEFGMGSSTSNTIRLHRDQEDTWVGSILASKPPVFRGKTIADKKEPQIIVVDPKPSSPTDRASPSSEAVNIHVIVDTFSHNCVAVLLDRVREGQWVDRKPYAMRVNTVADIFHRVGWRQDLLRSDARCSLDDAGILYDPEDEVMLYGGYFGTLHVASVDRDSSSTSYGTCESDLEDIQVRGFDDVALFQTFARFMDWEWQKVGGQHEQHEHESSLKEWSCRNEREDQNDQLPIPGDDEGEEEEGDYEQDVESPSLLDIPVMSRAWTEIEDSIRANSQGETGYPLVTFGLREEALGRRDITVRSLEPHALRGALYTLWEDCVPQFATIEVHLVMPQPLAELQLDKATVLLIEIFEDDEMQERKPVLSIVCDDGDTLIDEPKPAFALSPTYFKYARLMFRHSHVCRPYGGRFCQMWIAGRQVEEDAPIPFVSGSLIKLTIGLPDPAVVQAMIWMPQFEVFLNHFNQHVQDDDTQASVVIHGESNTYIIPALHSVVNSPPQFWEVIAQALQSRDFVIQYTSNGQVGLSVAPNQNSFQFVWVEPAGTSCALIVTRTCDSEGGIRPIGVRVLVGDAIDDAEMIHHQLAPIYEYDSGCVFQVHYVDSTVDHALECQGAQVILHTLHLPREHDRERSRTPRRLVDSTTLNQESESPSLLQTNYVILRYGVPPEEGQCSSNCELVQRTNFVQDHLHHFHTPMAWARIPVEMASFPDSIVEALFPAALWQAGTQVFIVIEVITKERKSDLVRLGVIQQRCNLYEVMQQCGIRCRASLVKHNGNLWTGMKIEWGNGDVLTIFSDDLGSFWHDDISPPIRGSNNPEQLHHTVFFDDTHESLMRMDFVGSTKKLLEWCGNQTIITVTRQPGIQQGCNHHVWLVSRSLQDDRVSFLLGVIQPNGKTIWEHKRTRCGGLSDVIPKASIHRYFRNGVPLFSPDCYPTKNGEVIICMVRTCRDVCGQNAADTNIVSSDVKPSCCHVMIDQAVEELFNQADEDRHFGDNSLLYPAIGVEFPSTAGEAPCPSDRWCAKLAVAGHPANGLESETDTGSEVTHDDSSSYHERVEDGFAQEETVDKCAMSNDRVTIHLNVSIPATSECNNACVTTLFQAHTWIEDLWRPWNTSLRQLPDGISLHPSTAHAIWHNQPVSKLSDKTYFLYVDGSAAKGSAGWAIAVIVGGLLEDGTHATHLLGMLYGKVATNEGHQAWMGAQIGDSIDAEIQAAIIATLFFLAHGEMFRDGPTFLCPDLSYSEGLVNGGFSPHQTRTATAVLSQIGAIATRAGLGLMHAKAHQGWEWNELVDTLAKHATSLEVEEIPPEVAFIAQMAKNHDGRRWLEWSMAANDDSVRLTFPPTEDGCSYDCRPPHIRDCPEIETVLSQDPGYQQTVQVKLMTANVLSLRDNDGVEQAAGRSVEMKTDRIDVQAVQEEVDILCVQEARTEAGRYRSNHYDIFAAGAETRGKSIHFGCEIWVRRGSKFDTSKALVVHSDPRLLFLQVPQGNVQWLVIAAHAPSVGSTHPIEQVQQWWCRFQSLVQKHRTSCFVLIGIDANASLASETTDSFAMYQAEPSSHTTPFFEKFLLDSRLFAPTTFSHIHVGEGWTWKHPKGKTKRIDYVLTSLDLAGWCTQSKVMADFDFGYAHEDHVPVQLLLHGVATSLPRERKLDETKMLDPEICRRFQKALYTLPMPNWQIDVETHAKELREQFRQLGLQFFANDSKPKKARWMTDTTANLIAFKRQVLQMLRRENDPQESCCLKQELRSIEKMVVAACFRDKRAYFDRVAKSLQEQGEAGNSKAVFHQLGRLSSKKKRQTGKNLQPLPEINGGNGPAATFEQKQETFFQQFAQIESADIVTIDELKKRCFREEGYGPEEIDLKFLPTVEQVGRKLKSMKRGKAPGPDGIVPALLKAGGQVI